MRCPVCVQPLQMRNSGGLTAFVCDSHGVWCPMETVAGLIAAATHESANARGEELILGYLLGRWHP